MDNKIKIGIAVGIAAIAIGLASPLFYDTEVNESLPQTLEKIETGLTYEKFVSMDNEQRQQIVQKMPENIKEMIMKKAETMTINVSENMPGSDSSKIIVLKSGEFKGLLGHNAKGVAKIIQVNNEVFLRFEDFEVTNGPDLHVYLTDLDGNVHNGIHLEKLKGSKGNQNYSLADIDFKKYSAVVVYCQPFSVHFGQANLE